LTTSLAGNPLQTVRGPIIIYLHELRRHHILPSEVLPWTGIGMIGYSKNSFIMKHGS